MLIQLTSHTHKTASCIFVLSLTQYVVTVFTTGGINRQTASTRQSIKQVPAFTAYVYEPDLYLHPERKRASEKVFQ